MLANLKSFVPSGPQVVKVAVAMAIIATVAAFVPPVRRLVTQGFAGLMPGRSNQS